MSNFVDMPIELKITEMSWPTKIVLGPGALQRVPAQVERLKMKRPLVVTDAGVVKAGLAERLLTVLRDAKIAFEVFDKVEPNPTEKDAFDGVAFFKEKRCDGVIGIGGGSPLDVMKLIQLLAKHEPPLSKYDDATGGDQFVRDEVPPSIAIPTTAGTGSEVSRSAVALLKDTGRKTVIFSPYLMPKAAICDPELTVGLPAGPTAATGMDAFTHCLESYLSPGFHPLADAVAIDGIARCARSLPAAVKTPNDLYARTDMMIAATQGAMAFQKGLGACHALAHALGPISGVHHGLANAVVLPTVMEFNRAAVTARLARVAVAMGDNSLSRQEVLAGNAIERVRRLNAEIGIPTRLRDVGVKEEDLGRISEKAFEDASHLSNPRKCTVEDLLSIARAAW
jgi:4-hydroxybutyrate dehydrogenase